MSNKIIYTYFTLYFLLNSAILYFVDGLKCYQCNSNTDTHCTEYFDRENSNIHPTECEVFEAKSCVKTTGMYKGEVGTQRFCASAVWGDICEMVKRKGDYREYRSCIYTCTSNECNSSSLVKSSSWILFLTCAFTYIYQHFAA